MALIEFKPPAGMEVTYEQWERMNASQKQLWLKRSGYFDAVGQANARGDTINWSLSPAGGNSSNSASTPEGGSEGSGGAKGVGGTLGGIAAEEGIRRGKDAILGGDKAPATAAPEQKLPSSLNLSTPAGNSTLQPVGSAANGGTIMSDGSTVMPNGDVQLKGGSTFNKNGVLVDKGSSGISSQDVMAGATIALSAYNAYQASKDKSLTPQQRNAIYAQSAASSVQAYNASSFGTGNPWVSGAATAVNVGAGLYGNANNPMLNNEEKAARGQQTIALGAADLFTGGLASPAAGAFKSTGIGKKLDEKLTKFDIKTNPITKVAGKYGLFGQDKWATELQRMAKLNGGDTRIPQSLLENLPTKGRSLDEVLQIEKEREAAGQHSNVKFAQSRDEKDLTPDDIMGYATFMEKYGNDWWEKYSPEQRSQIAQAALDAKAVDEHHGTVDVSWSPELDARVSEILANKAQVANNQTSVSKDPAQQPLPSSIINKPAPIAPGGQSAVASAAATDPNWTDNPDPAFQRPIAKMPTFNQERTTTRSPGIRLDGTLINAYENDPKKKAATNRALLRR